MTLGDLLNSGWGLNGVILLQKTEPTNRASVHFRRTILKSVSQSARRAPQTKPMVTPPLHTLVRSHQSRTLPSLRRLRCAQGLRINVKTLISG